MNYRFLYYLFTLYLLLCPGFSPGQNLSTEGDDFWIGFMDNWLQDPNNPIILEVYISANDTTQAHIEMPLYSSAFLPIDTTILPDRTVRIQIPTYLGMANGTNIIENRGIHVTSDRDVSVYAMNKRQYSADMAVILPAYALGNDYVIISHWEDGNRNNNNNSDSEFLLVAVEDNTRIEIIPSQITEAGNPAHIPFSILLNRGQTYQVQARADLTGTIVQAVANTDSECKRFAVFAGNQYTKVGECDNPNGHDHLYAQMYPVYTWGKEYITVSFNTRYNGDHVKVIASQDNSEILLNGQPAGILQRGEFLFLKELDGVNYISSEKPISVAQFSRSQACDGTTGDPFVILINPNEQVLKKITFYAPTIATIQNYNLSIITKTSDVSSVRLDDRDISDRFSPVPYKPTYSFARLSVSGGNHTLKSSEGLIAYVYGYGNNESFGYPTGAGLTNLNLNFLVKDDQGSAVPFDQVCHDTEIWFKPETEFEFTEFHWDFGDGEVYITGKPDSVPHIYRQPGKYIVELKGISGSSGCLSGAEQSSIKVVYVVNPHSHILGPRSVCPFTEGVPYYIRESGTYINTWFVEGGMPGTLENDTIFIDWGDTNDESVIKLLSVNHLGCIGDTVLKPVKIKLQLDPEAPMGPDSLCADQITGIDYQAYYVPGTTYQWNTDFGEIRSGQGNNQITMDWDSYGSGKVWYMQESLSDTVCSGFSDTLSVYIQRKPGEEAFISTEKLEYGINEPVKMKLVTDSLYQIASWIFDEDVLLDSISIFIEPERKYNCPGKYLIQATAMDTAGLCFGMAPASLEIKVTGPEIEIIQVTHEDNISNELFIKWKYQENPNYNKPYYLDRELIAIDTLAREHRIYRDTTVNSDDQSYEYQISTNHDCKTQILSAAHRSIWLNLPDNDQSKDQVMLEWTEYEGWQEGVAVYEIWMQVDGEPFSMIGEKSDTRYEFENQDLGFEHCFKIRAVEMNGNNAYSWSNISCITFVPELYPYNIITPNGDGLNDTFIIENIEHYPNAELTIYNRWGNRIYHTTGYKNNWEGRANGKLLPNSTYYYVLELNESRAGNQYINGMISILR